MISNYSIKKLTNEADVEMISIDAYDAIYSFMETKIKEIMHTIKETGDYARRKTVLEGDVEYALLFHKMDVRRDDYFAIPKTVFKKALKSKHKWSRDALWTLHSSLEGYFIEIIRKAYLLTKKSNRVKLTRDDVEDIFTIC